MPKLIYNGIHGGKDHLLMSRVKGRMSCDFSEEAEYLVTMLAKGLERLHSMDITDCPVSGGLDSRLAAARYNVEHGLCTTENVQPDTYGNGGFSCPKGLLCNIR